MKNTFSILFWVNQNRGKKVYCKTCGNQIKYDYTFDNGKGKPKGKWFHKNCDNPIKEGDALNPVFCKLTINSIPAQFFIEESIDPERWDIVNKCLKGSKADARQINEVIEGVKRRLLDIKKELKDKSSDITSDRVKNIYMGVSDPEDELKVTTLVKAFDLYLLFAESQKGKNGFKKSTIVGYKYTLVTIKDFLKTVYKKDDFRLEDIDKKFMNDLLTYCTLKNFSTGYIKIKFSCLNGVYDYAYDKDWIEFSKISGFNIKKKLKEDKVSGAIKNDYKKFTPEQVDAIRKLRDDIVGKKKGQLSLDYILFSIEHGQAYIDIVNLKEDYIIMDINGRLWIDGQRVKRGIPYAVPLTPFGEKLINYYKTHRRKREGFVFPYLNYDNYRWQLSLFSEKLGFDVKSHYGRHTFGDNVVNNLGYRMEVAQLMLGHASISTTEKEYVRVRTKTVMEEVKKMEEKNINNLESKAN